ncbi:hypothetical protein CI109_105945 [Kwoniella shandongensis]|uniref:Uncharacterized protein n=1 Tax=Kwoniella shandongensis TaxID=1734106 RepID=A0A5M6BY24_9TREE|nr:uncharacterized protein CI109_004007 [Kwoniella shandongensis]KAA5527747.1 hypothetical protein CI109_004007 [Kwoniella shandongensis]
MDNLAGSSASTEMIPLVRTMGLLTIRALDSLPLPVLLVMFIACLALLRWPMSQSPSILPTFTPPTTEKDRLSPSPFPENAGCKPLFTFSPLQFASASASSTNTTSASGAGGNTCISPQYSNLMFSQQQMMGMPQPSRSLRRGSKQLREYRLGLGVVPEVEGESLDRSGEVV